VKIYLKAITVSLGLVGAISLPAFADSRIESDTHSVKKLSSQQLEQQLNQLQKEVSELQKQLRMPSSSSTHSTKHLKVPHTPSARTAPDNLTSKPFQSIEDFPIDMDVPGKSFVSSGPYIGIPVVYSGSNLIINSPSVNEDVILLGMRKTIHNRLVALGRQEEADHSHILLSGIVEGQGSYQDKGTGGNPSDLDLTSANLDAYVLGPSEWTSALIELGYDNSNGINSGTFNSNSRSQNSRVYVNKAFIVIGNFLRSPFYSSLGQMYVPFGTYATTMITNPMTTTLARTKDRALVLGYAEQAANALYASLFAFRGDSHASATSHINNGGINIGYKFKQDKWGGNIGGGVLANLADSSGMQYTGNSPYFGGFGGANGSGQEKIVHRVPAYDVRGQFSFKDNIDLIGEYITASTAFNPNDMSVNTHGAKPQALHTEAVYTFQNLIHPVSAAVAYDMSKDALAIGLPAKRYSFMVNTSFWRDTLQTVELRHDINYSGNNTSSGSSIPSFNGTGKSDNVITAQFDVYF